MINESGRKKYRRKKIKRRGEEKEKENEVKIKRGIRKNILRVMNEREVYGWMELGLGKKGMRKERVSVRKERQV